jgi:hypothetical protein
MRRPDALADLATELRAMPARHRHDILKSLSPAERSRMTALLNRPAPAPAPPALPQPAKTDGLSPWLKARVIEARMGPEHAGSCQLTAATRQLLLRSVESLGETAAPPVPPARESAGRSLVGAIGGKFLRRRAAS